MELLFIGTSFWNFFLELLLYLRNFVCELLSELSLTSFATLQLLPIWVVWVCGGGAQCEHGWVMASCGGSVVGSTAPHNLVCGVWGPHVVLLLGGSRLGGCDTPWSTWVVASVRRGGAGPVRLSSLVGGSRLAGRGCLRTVFGA